MWKTLAGLVFFGTTAFAQEQFTAYDALRVVGVHVNREAVNQVVSVTGARGNPQPQTWRVLIADRTGRGGFREIRVRNGQVVSDRPSSLIGSAEGATINTSRLNLDSSGAFAVASHTAEKSGMRFDTASYTLRTSEHGDPVWIVTLQTRSGRPVGTIYIGANRGNVTRTEGMFAGTSMNDVETERETAQEPANDDEGNEGEHGPLHGVRSRIRSAFRRTQEEASDMFGRVQRSFSDFINR